MREPGSRPTGRCGQPHAGRGAAGARGAAGGAVSCAAVVIPSSAGTNRGSSSGMTTGPPSPGYGSRTVTRAVAVARAWRVEMLVVVPGAVGFVEGLANPTGADGVSKGPAWLVALVAPAMALPLLFHRRAPFAAPVATVAVALAASFVGNGQAVSDSIAPFFLLVVAAWSLGQLDRRRQRVPAQGHASRGSGRRDPRRRGGRRAAGAQDHAARDRGVRATTAGVGARGARGAGGAILYTSNGCLPIEAIWKRPRPCRRA